MYDDKVRPTPEIVCPKPFDVRELPRGGHTSRASGVYAAPFDDTPFARAIRVHEYLHLKLSPDAPEPEHHGVSEDALLAVEDARINEGGARLGFTDVLLALDDPSIGPPHPARDLRRATLFLIASHRTGTFARSRDRLLACGDTGRFADRLAARALAELAAPAHLPGFEATVRVARMLDKHLGAGAGGGRRKAGGHDPHTCGLAGLIRPAEGGTGAEAGRRARAGAASAAVSWGELRRVEEPPRTVACPLARPASRLRATDEGAVLRYPHRLLVDGRVFVHRSRLPGGAVLIDASGSMHLTPKALLEIVEAAAGALVACYDGCRDGFGEIRVLARAGRRVEDRLVGPPTGRGGNVVDGPALRWLAARQGPRIWISDGGVTGVGDSSSPHLTEEAREICRAASIVRVDKVAEASRLLRGGAAAASSHEAA
jgi:hypothetical protein